MIAPPPLETGLGGFRPGLQGEAGALATGVGAADRWWGPDQEATRRHMLLGLAAVGAGFAVTLHLALIGVAVWSEAPAFAPADEAVPVEVVAEIPKPPVAPKLAWPEAPDQFQKPEPKPPQPKPAEQKPAESKPAGKPATPQAPAAPVKSPQFAPVAAAKPAAAAPAPTAGATPPPSGLNTNPPAFAQAPKPVLRAPADIYAQTTFELLPATFQNRALTTEGQAEADDYKAQVFAKLEEAKQIPAYARALSAPVATVIAFTLDLNGQIVSESLVRSSGIQALDAEAFATLHRAAPFPLPPPQAQLTFAPAIVFGAD